MIQEALCLERPVQSIAFRPGHCGLEGLSINTVSACPYLALKSGGEELGQNGIQFRANVGPTGLRGRKYQKAICQNSGKPCDGFLKSEIAVHRRSPFLGKCEMNFVLQKTGKMPLGLYNRGIGAPMATQTARGQSKANRF
jgi:hypothetical protein